MQLEKELINRTHIHQHWECHRITSKRTPWMIRLQIPWSIRIRLHSHMGWRYTNLRVEWYWATNSFGSFLRNLENNQRPFSLISQPHVVSHTAQAVAMARPHLVNTHLGSTVCFCMASYWVGIDLYGIVLGAEFRDDEIPNLASLNTILDFRIFGQCTHLAGSKNLLDFSDIRIATR